MLKELGVEHYQFTCRKCGTSWADDYEVQRVEDLDGDCWEYYSLKGSPVTAPHAPGSVTCPGCGSLWISVDLAARREVPLAADAPVDWPRHPVEEKPSHSQG